MRPFFVSLCGGLLLAVAVMLAQAHAHLLSSTPADNSRITALPTRLVLRFSEPGQLTALWLQKDGGEKQKVTALPSAASAQVAVALPRLAPGTYVVSWRVLSADGHVVPGQIRFTLAPSS